MAATVATTPVPAWQQELQHLEPRLQTVLKTIFEAVVEVSSLFETAGEVHLIHGKQNLFGDNQIKADVQADDIIFKHLKRCGVVHTATSEEQPDMVSLGGDGYSVAFDPLDGSSVVAANFAVGSIFGVWPAGELVGQKGEDQVAALYSIYGPRTIVVLAHERPGADGGKVVKEFMLVGGQWLLVKSSIELGQRNVCAPGNMRAAGENVEYQKLMNKWVSSHFTLRYSGSMVADVHHILAKGGGVFISPTSTSAPAKLRLLYECQPLAYVIEAAGGRSHDGDGSLLAREVPASSARTAVCLGSGPLVEMCVPTLRYGQQ